MDECSDMLIALDFVQSHAFLWCAHLQNNYGLSRERAEAVIERLQGLIKSMLVVEYHMMQIRQSSNVRPEDWGEEDGPQA